MSCKEISFTPQEAPPLTPPARGGEVVKIIRISSPLMGEGRWGW